MHIIRIAFGGANENLIVSGSEDSNVYVWNRDKGDLLAVLEGHSEMVNCVHWNPRDPMVLLSGSDDKTIRLWGSQDMDMAEIITEGKDIRKIDASYLIGGA